MGAAVYAGRRPRPAPARGVRAWSTIARVRRTVILLCAAFAVTLAQPAGALRDEARVVEVAVGNADVRGKVVSTCVTANTGDGEQEARCTEAQRPVKFRRTLRLKGGARVRMLFGATPSQVKWRLLSGADGETVAADRAHRKDRRRRFVFHLPRRLPCATILNVAATYREGPRRTDMDYWVKVRTPRCRR